MTTDSRRTCGAAKKMFFFFFFFFLVRRIYALFARHARALRVA